MIEKLEPNWLEPGRREYHGMTRGWVANEVFRRLEPRGRTIGEYLAEDVARPLKADVYVGVPQNRLDDFASAANIGPGKVIKESMKTNTVGGAVDIGFFEFITLMNNFRKMFAEGQSKPVFNPYQDYDQKRIDLLFNKDVIRRGESSSANGNCSARGLALVAAAMANKGHHGPARASQGRGERKPERERVCVMAGHHSIKFMCEWCPGGREDGWDPEQE